VVSWTFRVVSPSVLLAFIDGAPFMTVGGLFWVAGRRGRQGRNPTAAPSARVPRRWWLIPLLLLVACGEPVAPLEGSRWRLVSLHGDPVVADDPITLRFEDGFVRGFGGCNAYRPLIIGTDRHEYTATSEGPAAGHEGTLTVPAFIVTEKDCPSPAGLMQQERAYFEALRAAARYRLDGERLAIEDGTGETTLVFVREEEGP
jgi:heat shock protein HslJ